MGEETWRVGVVVFIYVSRLHFVMFRWMCGIWIDFSTSMCLYFGVVDSFCDVLCVLGGRVWFGYSAR